MQTRTLKITPEMLRLIGEIDEFKGGNFILERALEVPADGQA